jgi:hypothetical protein
VYVAEAYLPRTSAGGCRGAAARARAAAAELRRAGTPVRFLRLIYVPSDELCLFVFDAASPETVARVADLAQLDPCRISDAQD